MRKKFLTIAKKEALKSKHQFLVGAILVDGSSIVSKGFNKPHKTHRLVYWNHHHDRPEFARMHAEIDALINVSKTISEKCTLYVVRVRKCDNKLAIAKPCKMCMEVIKAMKIKKVIYSIEENHYGIIDLKNQ
mgnify:CR=1 FL=1